MPRMWFIVPAGLSANDIAEEYLSVPPVPHPSPVITPRCFNTPSINRSSKLRSRGGDSQGVEAHSDLNKTPLTLHSGLDTASDTDNHSTSSSEHSPKMLPLFSIDANPPFQDPMESLGVQSYDVLKIKNVPYTVTIAEMKAFAGRLTSSPLIKDHIQGFPVHIIMERSTAKTMDCFVEFQHQGAAKAAVNRAEQMMSGGRPLKLGSRRIDVEISSEGELCSTLFPRAKSTSWNPSIGVPTVMTNRDPFSEGFQGFLTEEELSNICKHANNPQKSSFNQRCPQRIYESMMSTLYKYPWHVPQNYTVEERDTLWGTYTKLLIILMAKVQPGYELQLTPNMTFEVQNREVGLSHSLLLEYVFAGMNAPMFSLRQKFTIAEVSRSVGPGLPLPMHASMWPFESLIPSKDCPVEIVDQWLRVLHAGYRKVVAAGNLVPGYVDYGLLGLDQQRRLKVQLNERGQQLAFRDLISMEKGLMEYYIEHGRYDWCEANCRPYHPLNLFSRPDREVEHLFGELVRSSSFSDEQTPSEGTTALDADEPIVSSNSMGKGHSVGEKRNETAKTFKQLPQDDRKVVGPNFYTQFDPSTPSFIPSQPWTGAEGGSGSASEGARAVTTPNRELLARALTPSWTSPQELPMRHGSQTRQSPVSISQRRTPDNGATHSPFSENTFPAFSRPKDVLPSVPRSAPRSVSCSSILANTAGGAKSNKNISQDGNDQIDLSLPPRPIFGNIWGPGITNRSSQSTRSYSDVLRQSVATESARAGSPRGSERDTTTSPLTVTSQRISTRRSRSSTGHDTLRIEATIHEEGNMNAREAASHADKAANDAGKARFPVDQ